MATGLAAQTSAGTDTAFIQRVQAAMLAAAQSISTESPTGTPNHSNRIVLMKAVVNSPGSFSPLFALLCASQGTDGTSTDVAIETMVSSVWNTLAGVP